MKTYLYQEVYGHKEITEWVPADVARELFEVLTALEVGVNLHTSTEVYHKLTRELIATRKALRKACGEL